ncbi:hypothetical protein ETB97_009404 [Aspergillus alliaceus]|uniref:Uncharacterized protein n=1 Tax=Petromyces alliaceus TaxID=209559 RepID=A0A8H6A9V8_PETAA|nr:hypothetical protein ETB97_009404 [Aspergillus burnettii]
MTASPIDMARQDSRLCDQLSGVVEVRPPGGIDNLYHCAHEVYWATTELVYAWDQEKPPYRESEKIGCTSQVERRVGQVKLLDIPFVRETFDINKHKCKEDESKEL